MAGPEEEIYEYLDDYGNPDKDHYSGQRIPNHNDPELINPRPGCFGSGPGKLATKIGRLSINTKSLITYARVYEFMLVLEKGDRRSKVVIHLDVGEIPAPIMEITCLSEELCFPGFDGVYVNPTSRLAIVGNCMEQCANDIKYSWEFNPPSPEMSINTVKNNVLET